IGHGAGTADPPGLANMLRLFVGTINNSLGSDQVWILETNLDDVTGEVVGHATTKLLEAGALDAYVTPILMKKNRPGVMISTLCDGAKIHALEDILFCETLTLGVRRYPVGRRTLLRESISVETRFGPVRGKLTWRAGQESQQRFSPEYDDCARAAAEQQVALHEVCDAACNAFLAQARQRHVSQ